MTTVVNINEPVVWETYDNIKISDIHPDKFETVTYYAMVNITTTHLLYRNSEIKGPIAQAAIDDINRLIGVILLDRISLIAVDENTNEIIGTIILKVMDDDFHSWTQILKIPQSEKLKAILNVSQYMLQSYNETHLEKCNYCLHSFFLFASKDYCGLKLRTKLLLAAERVAASMRIPYLTNIAFSSNNQVRALRAHMTEAYRIYYALYKDLDGKRPFDIKFKREWYCILYIKSIVPQIPYTDL